MSPGQPPLAAGESCSAPAGNAARGNVTPAGKDRTGQDRQHRHHLTHSCGPDTRPPQQRALHPGQLLKGPSGGTMRCGSRAAQPTTRKRRCSGIERVHLPRQLW